jgi:hypothetical protein
MNLQFEQDDQFPALEELTFDSSCQDTYYLSTEHCQQWLKCMDWTKMRKLDLGRGMPRYLLAALTGHVSQLKHLTLGLWPNQKTNHPIWDCPDLDVVRRFVASIDGLEHLQTYSWYDKEYSQIRPALLDKHGPTLLHFNVTVTPDDAWTADEIATLVTKAPNLQSLCVMVKMHEQSPCPHSKSIWVCSCLSPIPPKVALLTIAAPNLNTVSYPAPLPPHPGAQDPTHIRLY